MANTRTVQRTASANPLDYIGDALAGKYGADQQRLAEAVTQLGTVLLNKNRAYGSSAWATPMMAPHMTTGDAILVRMSDKVQRITNLLSIHPANADVVKDETVDDTFLDLAGYCLLYVARPRPSRAPGE
jgi:hypothetical protein